MNKPSEISPLQRPPTFFSTFGKLPGTWWILLISVFAGIFEGFGLTLFFPLIALMNGTNDEPTGLLKLIDDVFSRLGFDLEVGSMLAVIVTLILTGFFLGYLHRRAVHISFNDYILILRNQIMGGMLNASWPFLSRQASGEVVNNLILETSQTSTGLMMQVHMAVSVLQVLILGIFSATLSLPLVLVTIGFSLMLVLLSRPIMRRSDALGRGLTNANQRFGFHSVDYMRGAYLIKTTASEEATLARLNSLSEDVYRMRLGLDLLSAKFQFMLQAMPVILVAGLIVIAYFWLDLEAAGILTFLLLMARIMPRLADIQQRYQSYVSYRPAFEVVDKMIRGCRENNEPKLRGGRNKPVFEEQIRFEKVCFAYPDTTERLIDAVEITIPKNHMIALVGSSGAGKTTVINLLAGLYAPDTGQVIVDETDIETCDLGAWRSRIGYVTQDMVTFNDTIRSNLCLGHLEATDEAIYEALETVQLTDLVAEMPEGLDTIIGENGVRLSGGQRQRLALARALLGKPEILLLDEATSALDNETERVIQNAIEALADKMTIVVVAHRLSTISRADHVYVMEKGRIVEDGNYASLLAKGGRFAELHRLQQREQTQ